MGLIYNTTLSSLGPKQPVYPMIKQNTPCFRSKSPESKSFLHERRYKIHLPSGIGRCLIKSWKFSIVKNWLKYFSHFFFCLFLRALEHVVAGLSKCNETTIYIALRQYRETLIIILLIFRNKDPTAGKEINFKINLPTLLWQIRNIHR